MAWLRRRLEQLLEWIVIGLMAALAGVVLLAVAFRKAGASLVWYDEVAAILLAWLTFYGAALAALRRAHIGFPTLVRAAPGRTGVALLAAREIAILGFFGLVAWAGVGVLAAAGGLTLASLPWLSVRLTQSVIPIGAALFVAAELMNAAQDLTRRARRP
jgi:TRAP-type C4-dicarboxylate transport system permease small subunit